mgnify:CR=1 FL=1
MSSEFGSLLKISVFGQSHGRAIGVVVDGLPAGEAIDLEELNAFLARRKPGKSPLSTARREADAPVFLSGLENGVTCGAPLCAVIENGDQHSSDYDALQDKPRPGHADYTAFVKWGGQADMRGGGHFSGRLTAPLCIAGGIAKQILSRRGVYVGAHLQSVGTVADALFPLRPTKELFDAVEVSQLKAGDTLTAGGQTVKVTEVKERKAGGVTINGGYEKGGITLFPGDGGTYYQVKENDAKTYVKVGTATLPLSDKFELVDNAENANKKLTAQDMTTLKEDSVGFNVNNTTATVENGVITNITRAYMP